MHRSPSTQSLRHSRSRRRWIVRAVLGLALAAAPGVQAAQSVSPPPGLKPPAKPTSMPAFELPTAAGGKLDSRSLAGQVVVVRFWASW